ncbi:hypothetical protein DFO45_2683 [Azorhizobium sp. AG788]|uniref:hypothetical protein n=1 Tax=Azorhizobium sp. AG788 TaxID=2183897 RepID=UPI00105F71FA|nr:hypothetical protein [Azorhizobium sp. AG788]TDT94925.1 hypothetical protein DFO45_2683 [Azorhizobium sp. AG788]
MALDISETIAAQMAGRVVRMSVLIHFDFLSGPVRCWPGTGPIVSGGHTWTGLPFELVTINPGTPSVDGAAEAMSVTVSGVSPLFVSKALAEASDAIGRRLQMFMQFFDADWQPLDGPISLRRGKMTGFSGSDSGPKTRTLTVNAEGPFTARGRPPATYLSSTTQQARFPGDRGCEFLPGLQNKEVVWPK